MLTRDHSIKWMLVTVSLMAVGALVLTPDITYKTVSKVEFGGGMGRVMNFAAKLGGGSSDVVETVYLKGNKMLQGTDEAATLTDLDAERLVMLNHKEKTYSAVSFDEFRLRMEETAAQIRAESNDVPEQEASSDVSFDLKVDRTGEKSKINGRSAERFLLTITMKAQDAAGSDGPPQQGTLVIATEVWMSEDVQGYEEIEAFHQRFAEKLGGALFGEAGVQNMADAFQQAFAGDPRIREGLEQAKTEAAKMKGVDVKNVTHVVTVAPGRTFNPDLVFNAEKVAEKKPKRGGLGRLARLAANAAGQNTADEPEEEPTQSTLLTVRSEMQEYSTAPVPASVFEIPSGYREVAFGM